MKAPSGNRMFKVPKLHIAYVAGDGAMFVELRRHLAPLVHGHLIELTHSGQLDDLRHGAESSAENDADILVLLVSAQLLSDPGDRVQRLRGLVQGEAKAESGAEPAPHRPAPVLVPILLDATSWPHDPRDACLPPRQSLAAFPSRELGWFAVVRGLRRVIDKVHDSLHKVHDSLHEKPGDRHNDKLGNVSTRAASLSLPPLPIGISPAVPVALNGPPRRKFALLVGVNRFLDGRTFPSLRYCVNDVLILRETLASQGYLVRLLHDEMPEPEYRPLRENVRRELGELCHQAQAEDLLLVHFACHGFVQGGQQYLAVHDTRPSRLADTAVSVSALEQQLRQCPARRRILILDACQSGATLHRGPEEEFIRFAFEQAEGFVRIAASTAQQKAQEWHDKKMGAFSYFLNAGLRGEARNQYGLVTVQTVANYVLYQLRKWTQENLGRAQEPTIQYEGMGEIILADYRSSSSPSGNSSETPPETP